MGGVRGDPQVSVLNGRIGPGTQEGEYRRRGSVELRFEELRVTAGHPGRDIRETWKDRFGASAPWGTLSPTAKRTCASFLFVSPGKANLVLILES